MGIISNLEKRSTLANPDSWLLDSFGNRSATGKSVNSDTAMTYTAYYACVRIIAETIASLPLHVYQRTARGKEKASGYPLHQVLHDMGNDEMTSFTYRETSMVHLLNYGNMYSEIEYDGGGRVRGLWPLNPLKMEVLRKSGRLVYNYTLPSGEQVTLPRERVLHIPGMGFDGVKGYNPITLAREAIGLGLSAEEYGARFFGNGAKPGGVLEHPHTLKEDAQKNLRTSWNEMHQGLEKQHRIAILEEGMQYKQIGIPPEEAQFLETRKFQVTEIARFFRVPPHMLADLERATFSNIEHQSIEFVVHTVRPWLVRWEQAINAKLFGQEGRKKYFAEFNVDGLLRGDIKTRYEAYAIAIQNSWMNRNEVREKENMNPAEGLDEFILPMNMAKDSDIEPIEEPQQRTEKRSLETRQQISCETRTNIATSYKRMMKDTLSRIMRREEADIMRQAKKQLRNTETFLQWLSDFYRQHEEFFKKTTEPVVMGLAEAVQRSTAKEVGGQVGVTPELKEFVKEYIDKMGYRHTGTSMVKLKRVIEKAIQEERDLIEDLQSEFDDWQEDRLTFETDSETIRASNAIAKTSYIFLGVTLIRWVTQGSETCEFCQSLDGKVIGVHSSFLKEGEEIQAKDGRLRVSSNIGHAPLHKGCECTIVSD
jgi:HK97 family phage portal protein